jgi:hypothetical protein
MKDTKPRKRAPRPGEGRPTAYQDAFAKQAKKLCELGATDFELAEFFSVSVRTIYRWVATKPEFCHALKAGKDVSDGRVEMSLYHRAVGYTFSSEKVFQFQGKIVRAPTTEHVPPDTTAGIFWLKNRRKEKWRDRQEVEHSGGIAVKTEAADEARRKLGALVAAGAASKVD